MGKPRSRASKQDEAAAIYLAPAELVPWEKNPRKNEHAVEKIAEGIKRFGFGAPIVARREDRMVIAGHTRLKAALLLGLERVPVRLLDLSLEEAEALALADNKLGELADWDEERLAAVVQELDHLEVDLTGLGWELGELDGFLAEGAGGGGGAGEEPEAGPPPEDPESCSGELYQLGPHRLLCGDSTKREDVRRVIGEEPADLLATDPPYGVAVASRGSERLSISGDLTQAAIPISFAVAVEEALSENARVYLCGGTNNFGMYSGLFDHHLRQQPRLIVWSKAPGFVLRPNNYHAQFELVYWGWKGSGGGNDYWFGDRKQTDVWTIPRDAASSYEHPTQKPTEIFQRMIRNSAPPGGVVFEPFCGSGSCLLASAIEGRRCFAVELDPAYCDVIRKRWGDYARKHGLDVGDGL